MNSNLKQFGCTYEEGRVIIISETSLSEREWPEWASGQRRRGVKEPRSGHLPNKSRISLTHTFSQSTPTRTSSFMFLNHQYFSWDPMALLNTTPLFLACLFTLLKLDHKLFICQGGSQASLFIFTSVFCLTVLPVIGLKTTCLTPLFSQCRFLIKWFLGISPPDTVCSSQETLFVFQYIKF